jgi:PTS system nitrogen regulatory IIA component
MATWQDLLDKTRVRLNMRANSVPALMQSLGLTLFPEDSALALRATEALLAREQQVSTGLGGGMALPHAAVPGLEFARAALVRLATSLDFSAPDGARVRLVFALVVPEHFVDEKLQLLAELADRVSDSPRLERLMLAATPDELLDAFRT